MQEPINVKLKNRNSVSLIEEASRHKTSIPGTKMEIELQFVLQFLLKCDKYLMK
jgi:hypothetical protein